MTSKSNRSELEELGFKMKDFGYFGIYRYEVFENEDLLFIISMDKCYFECYLYLESSKDKRYSILDIARKALQAPDYMLKELEGVPKHAVFIPDRCIKILVENYQAIKTYLFQNELS